MTDREELDSVKRMLGDACSDLGAIHEALGLDHEEAGGAAPILEAIERLQVRARNLVPRGWKMVPIEPTEEMWVVGFEAVSDFQDTDEYQAMAGCKGAAESAKVCYQEMLRAAPKPVGCDTAAEESPISEPIARLFKSALDRRRQNQNA